MSSGSPPTDTPSGLAATRQIAHDAGDHASELPSLAEKASPSSKPDLRSSKPNTRAQKSWLNSVVGVGAPLRPFRLLRQDINHLTQRYISDWTIFNQLIIASAVYVFFTNLLPGITFASDLYVLTGQNWGTIEVVFSTGLCGVIFSMYVLSKLYS